jgi:F0F1-type ATP synthase membrane subunit a
VANDPISQFQIKNIVPIEIGGLDLSFTNSSLFMVATVGVAAGFLFLTTANRGLVPSRLQSISEMSYEFVASMLRDGGGSQGMRFFPMVFSLFMFVLVANLFGHVPLLLHRHQPPHRYLRAGDARDRHRRRLRLHGSTAEFPRLFVPSTVFPAC